MTSVLDEIGIVFDKSNNLIEISSLEEGEIICSDVDDDNVNTVDTNENLIRNRLLRTMFHKKHQ